MPSGKTHDRITWLGLVPLVSVTYILTRSFYLALLLGLAYLFSGLMFGPDLDIHSLQYKRWGWFRWFWLPYRFCLPHRSILSHGFLLGTCLRLLYLMAGIILLAALMAILLLAWGLLFPPIALPLVWMSNSVRGGLTQIPRYRAEIGALLIGLEAGAMSHSGSDQLASYYKALKKKRGGRRASKR
jgi:uncharacterized metal-binding protein